LTELPPDEEVDISWIKFADKSFNPSDYKLDHKGMSVFADMCSAGLWVYEATKEISAGMPMERLERLPVLKQVEQSGMFIASVPPIEEIPALSGGMVNCRILFGSEKSPDAIRDDFMDPIRVVVEGGDASAKGGATEETGAYVDKSVEEVVKATDASLIYEFVRNASAGLEGAAGFLSVLKRDPANLAVITETHRIFRSLKGMSVIFGFVKIAILAGRMEVLFEKLIAKKVEPNDETFDFAEHCLERLNMLVGEAQTGKDTGVLVADLTDKADRLVGHSERGFVAVRGLLKGEPSDISIISKISDDEQNLIAEEREKSRSIYEVKIGVDENALEMGYEPLSLVPTIEQAGSIIARIPTIENVPEIFDFDPKTFNLGFRFVLSSEMTRVEIEERMKVLPKFVHVSVKQMFAKGAAEVDAVPSPVKRTPVPTPPSKMAEVKPPPPVSSDDRRAHEAASNAQELDRKPEDKSLGTIRVNTERVDKLLNLVGEIVIDRTRMDQIGAEINKTMSKSPIAEQFAHTNQLFHRHMNEIQEMVMSMRMVQVGTVFNKFPRIVRDLSKSLGKNVTLVLTGEKTELDKTLIEEISDPLVHLVRNAIDHGMEPPKERLAANKPGIGTIELKASHEGDSILLEIADDGRGMNIEKIRAKAIERGLLDPADTSLGEKEILNFIFEPGFSTAETATVVSGRGVGMDVVKKNIAKLKGMIDIRTELGKGSRIVIRLPLTLAIVPTLVVRARDERFAIPLSSVVESLRVFPGELKEIQGREMITLRDSVLPLARLDEIFQLDKKKKKAMPRSFINYRTESAKAEAAALADRERKGFVYIVVVGLAEKRLGLVVSELKSQQEVVIKKMGPLLKDVPCISGATIMGDGRVALILDAGQVIEESLKADRRVKSLA
jgi:two-component system chemotaxis sensor kinase CheA